MIDFTLDLNDRDSCLIIRPGAILSGNFNLSRDCHLHQLVTYSRLVVMDFSQVSFMDIAALRQILSLRDWAWQQALDFQIENATGQVLDLLQSADLRAEYWTGSFHETVPSTITAM